jgi:hypothetical protein
MTKLKAEIKTLPEKHKFDSSFNIVETEIKSRYRRVIPLTDSIKLELTENIQNLRGTIEATRISGKNGIFIKTEEGYRAFHRE